METRDRAPDHPLCPNCGKPMRLARVIPRLGGQPELHTFECRGCGVVYTEATKSRPGIPRWPARPL